MSTVATVLILWTVAAFALGPVFGAVLRGLSRAYRDGDAS